MRFQEFLNEIELTNEMEDRISMIMYLNENNNILIESVDNLTEAERISLEESIHDWLAKAGLKLHKSDGIIDYVIQFTKGAGKIIMAAFNEDAEEVKKIANSLKKETVVDFLLKLDMATMHIITGPIHFIDAITGWDLMSNISAVAKKAESKLKLFYKAIQTVKDSLISVLSGTKQKSMLKLAGKIEHNIPAV